MRKKLLIAFVSLSLLCALSWYLGARLVRAYLHSVCVECFGVGIESEGVQLDHEYYLLKNPRVTSSIPLMEGGFDCSASEIVIRYNFHPLRLILDLDVTINHLALNCSAATDIAAIIQKIMEQNSFLTVRPNIVINEGVLKVHDSASSSHNLYLSTALDFRDRDHGHVALSIDNPSYQENALDLRLRRDEEVSFALDLSLRKLNLSEMAKTLGVFHPLFRKWKVESGIVDGEITFSRKPEKRLDADGMISLRDLSACNKEKQFHAILGSLVFDFTKDNRQDRLTLGRLLFGGDSSFSFGYQGMPVWEVKNLSGGVRVEKHGSLKAKVMADCCDQKGKFSLETRAAVTLFDAIQAFVNLSIRTWRDDGQGALVEVSGKQINALWNSAEVSVNNLGHREVQFMNEGLVRWTKMWSGFALYEGMLNTKATAYFKGLYLHNIELEQFEAKDLVFDCYPYEVFGSVKSIVGSGTMNFSGEDPTESLETEFDIEQGTLRFVGMNRELWQLTDIQTKLAFQGGVIQRSIVNGTIAGFKGTFEVDWLSQEEIVKMRFLGNPQELSTLLPTRIRKGLQKGFLEDQVTFNASLSKKGRGYSASGIIEVQDQKRVAQDAVAFGFDFEHITYPLSSKKRQKNINKEYFKKLQQESLRLVLPALAAPIFVLEEHLQTQKKGLSGFIVKNGWVYGEDLPLEKFVAPFAFQEEEEEVTDHPIELSGVGNFQGEFDHTGLSVSYTARDVTIQSKDFSIQVESVNPTLEGMAVHHVELNSGHHFGKIPICHATYYEKNTGLTFTDVNTVMKLEGEKIHAADLEAFCLGIFFSGDVNIDVSSKEKGAFDAEVIVEAMSGKISDVQAFFSHFANPPLFSTIPLEGLVTFREEGGYLGFSVRPNKTEMVRKVSAQLTDGVMDFSPLDLSLYDLEVKIDYDQIANTFLLTDLQGTLLVGKPGAIEEYLLEGDQIAFTDFSNNVSSFDFWIGDKKRDIFRLVGTTTGRKEEHSVEEWVSVKLDQTLSHFGTVFPNQFDLTVKDWSKVEDFELDLEIELKSVYEDLIKLAHSGLFFLPPTILQEMKRLNKVDGEFSLHFKYDQDLDHFQYDLTGREIVFGKEYFPEVLFLGHFRRNKWAIEQMKLADFSLAANFSLEPERFKIEFLGVEKGNSLRIGLRGDYFKGSNVLDARIDLLEISLDDLSEWSSFNKFVNENRPHGILKGTGELRVEQHHHQMLYNGFFTMDTQDLILRGVSFKDIKGFSAQFISDQGLNLRNIVTDIQPLEEEVLPPHVQIEKISLSYPMNRVEFDSMQFQIPHSSLNWFGKTLKHAFPENVTENVVEIIGELKEQDLVEASLNLLLEEEEEWFQLNLLLQEGEYYFAGRDHPIKNFSLTLDPDRLNIVTQYRYKEKEFWVDYSSTDPSHNLGSVLLTENDPRIREHMEDSLSITVENHPQYGLFIHEAVGKLGGMTLNLKRDWNYSPDQYYSYLVGSGKARLPEAFLFANREVLESCKEQKIAGEIGFEGKVALSKKDDYPSKVVGAIHGQEIAFKGFVFDHFAADLYYRTDSCQLTDLVVTDAACVMEIPRSSFTLIGSEKEYWWMDLPKVHVEKFRPSLLREKEKSEQESMGKALVLNAIDIHSVVGELGNTNTWQGGGNLHFLNPPKTSLQRTFLALPHEIITRLGLNPSVLTPVSGSIYFTIDEGKILFTKFKDIYSEAKGSKFYLAGGDHHSFIDFDGNLDIKLKMKQYNLLFKLAELFTVSVKGTLQKPVYSLQKERSKNSKKALN